MLFKNLPITALLIAGAALSAGCSVGNDAGEAPPTSAAEQSVSPDSGSDPASCFDGVVGDGATCVDPGELKMEASLLCEQAGLVLVDIKYSDGGCGGQTSEASYSCCVAPPPPPVDPGPDPGTCMIGEVGDGVTCENPDDLKLEASLLCEQAGLALTDFKYADDGCGGQTRMASYACCAAAAAPPPPPAPEPDPSTCVGGVVGDGATCVDPGVLKEAALAACLQAGLDLYDFEYSDDACGGQTQEASYTCCALTVGPAQ